MEPIIKRNMDFKTILFSIYYPVSNDKKDVVKRNLLGILLTTTCSNYPEIADFQKAILRNSIVSLSSGVRTCGDGQAYLGFHMSIPDPRYYGEDVMEASLKFLTDIIYNPDIKEKSFNEKLVQKQKDLYKMQIEKVNNNVGAYSKTRILDEIDKQYYFNKDIYHNEHLIDETDGKIVYEYYLKEIKDKVPLVFAFGDICKDKLTNILNKYLYIDGRSINSYENKPYCFFEPNRKDVNIVRESKPFNQSTVNFGYLVSNMQERDLATLKIIDCLLDNAASNLLFKKLRLEHELVYMTGAMTLDFNGVLCIVAFLDKKNIDDAIKVIKETMDLLSNEKVIEPLLESVKNKVRIDLEYDKDNKNTIFYDFINEYMGFSKPYEKLCEESFKITSKDIKEFTSRLKLDTIYCLEGEANE